MKYLKYIAVIPGFIVAIVIVVSSMGKVKLPVLDVKTSFKKIDAEAEAKKLKAEMGAEAASQEIVRRFAVEAAALDDEETAEFEELKDDPVKLARLLAGKKV